MFKKQFENIDFRLNAIAQALTELHNENEQNKFVEKYADYMEKLNETLFNRIDKAIEYIENDLQSFLYSIEYKTLLEILKGEE